MSGASSAAASDSDPVRNADAVHRLMDRTTLVRLTDRSGLAVLIGVGLVVGIGFAVTGSQPVDTALYWQTAQSTRYYGEVWAQGGAFYVYPPPLAQLVGLLTPMGWEAFVVTWTLFTLVGLWVMTRGLAIATILVSGLGLILVGDSSLVAQPLVLAMIGNIGIWLLAAIVLGFRWPAFWALVVLTKIAPGVGLLWFVFRREWRNLAIALAAIGSVAAISFVAAPNEWAAFVRFAMENVGTPSPNPIVPIPLPVRVAMSIGIIAWGARTDRPWVLPFAAGWSSIALYQWSWVSMVLASLAMLVWTHMKAPTQDELTRRLIPREPVARGTAT